MTIQTKIQKVLLATTERPHIEGSDSNKNNPSSPHHSPSIVRDRKSFPARNESWLRPNLLPDHRKTDIEVGLNPSVAFPDYGGTGFHHTETQRMGEYKKVDERKTLLEGSIPYDICVRNHKRRSSLYSRTSIRRMSGLHSLAESVFSDIRSHSVRAGNAVSIISQKSTKK